MRSSPSTRTCISALRHLKNTSTSATKKLAFPPIAFDFAFARRATAALMPALPMFAKYSVASTPAHERNVTLPRSISRATPFAATRAASSGFVGIP